MSDYVFPELPTQIWPVEREQVWDGLHIEATPSGREFRSLSSTYPRQRYDIRYSALDGSRYEAQRLVDLFNSMGSGFDHFLFRDRDDDRVTLQQLGVTTGAASSWQLGRAIGNLPMNLLAYSGAPISGWNASEVTRSIGYPSRDTLDAALLTESTTASASHLTYQGAVPVLPGQDYTFACKLLPNGRNKVRLSVLDHVSTATMGGVDVDLTTGLYTVTSGTVLDARLLMLAGGMRLACLTVPMGATVNSARARLQLLNGSGSATYTGDGISGMWFADAELYRGAFLGSPTQRTAGAVPPVQFLAPIFDLASAPSIYLADDTGVELQTSSTYTISATGLLTFNTPPASGRTLLWSGGFYHRARFADSSLSVSQFTRNLYSTRSVRLITVKP